MGVVVLYQGHSYSHALPLENLSGGSDGERELT